MGCPVSTLRTFSLLQNTKQELRQTKGGHRDGRFILRRGSGNLLQPPQGLQKQVVQTGSAPPQRLPWGPWAHACQPPRPLAPSPAWPGPASPFVLTSDRHFSREGDPGRGLFQVLTARKPLPQVASDSNPHPQYPQY